MGHPDVQEAAVIGVRHVKWDERPLLIVVPKEGRRPEKQQLLDLLGQKFAKWQLPDDVLLDLAGTGRVTFHESDELLLHRGKAWDGLIRVIQQGKVEVLEERKGETQAAHRRSLGFESCLPLADQPAAQAVDAAPEQGFLIAKVGVEGRPAHSRAVEDVLYRHGLVAFFDHQGDQGLA